MGGLIAGSVVLGSLVQLYNSEKARGAEKSRLNSIQKLYDEIKPPDYDLKIQDPPQLHEEALAKPNFNLQTLTPEQFKQIGQFVPQTASYVAENAPQLIQKTSDMKSGREAQLSALRRLQQVGSGEFDPEYQEAVTKAGRQAQAEAQSRQASLLQDFARRGQSGSGLQLAAQLSAGSQAANNNAMNNLSAATQAYRNQLQALSQGAQLGGQISQEDQNLQARNADIINAFNQRMAASRQGYENQRANTLNQAQQYNLGTAQNVANMNTQALNAANQAQQQRLDSLAKWGYDTDVNERNYQNQLAMSKYGIQQSAQDKLNALKRQQFQDQLSVAGGKAGISNQIGQADMSAAQDRNAAIQGLSNAGVAYANSQQALANQQQSNMTSANNAFMSQNGRFMTPDEKKQYMGDEDAY